ncbi:MAG: hypothetical protein WA118_02630 [Carboxydocellales bacterium]
MAGPAQDTAGSGGYALFCIGLSELVKNVEATFMTDADKIYALPPEETVLVQDDSPQYRCSILYIQSLFRKIAPTDVNIYIGHQAAINGVT